MHSSKYGLLALFFVHKFFGVVFFVCLCGAGSFCVFGVPLLFSSLQVALFVLFPKTFPSGSFH